MHAAIVTLWHISRDDIQPAEIHHHLEWLSSCPGLHQYAVLKDGAHCALVLIFTSEDAADTYLESEAVDRLACAEGCRDVFVRRFPEALPFVDHVDAPATDVLAEQAAFIEEGVEA